MKKIKKPGTVKESGGLVVYYKTNLSKGNKIVSHYEDHLLWLKQMQIIAHTLHLTTQTNVNISFLDVLNVLDEIQVTPTDKE